MKISFAPLRQDASDYLSYHVGIDYEFGAPFELPNWFCATARDEEGRLLGVLACEFKSSFDVHFNTAITDPRCMSRKLLKALFTALFFKAVRVTALVDVNNVRAIRQMKRLGFIYEGFIRKGIDGVRDGYMFGMLKEDCKYLPGYAGGTTVTMEYPDGQPTETARPV